MSLSSDARVDRLRRVNRQKTVQRELQQQQQDREREEQRQRLLLAAQRDAALAEELQAVRQNELRDTKMIQLVREHPEIRDLEAKLRAAHCRVGLMNQMEERKQRENLEEKIDRDYMDAIADDAKKYEEEERQKKLELQQRLRDQQHAQQDQIAWRKVLDDSEAEQRRREKADVDAIVARVQEQDFMDTLSRIEKQRATKKQHEEFCTQRDAIRRDEQARLKAEEQAIIAYMAEQNKRKESDEKLKKEKEMAKARILEEQSRRIAAEQARKEELEMLINEYYEEQRVAKMREDEQKERERRERDREMMIAANHQQSRLKAERREQERAEEQEFRKKMMEQFAANDRLEQQTKQRQHQMKVEHAKKVQELIDEKRRLKEDDLRREAFLAEQNRQREEELKLLIAQERARLLSEHLPQLGSTLPKGLAKGDLPQS